MGRAGVRGPRSSAGDEPLKPRCNCNPGPSAHGYGGHPAMKLPPEINLIAVSHYLQALEYQRYSNQIVAMLGGKTPHIQNVAVGGVAVRAPRRLHPQRRPLQARPHHRPEGRDLAPRRHRRQRPRLVQRRRPAASVERRDRPRAHRVGRREEILLGQSPALRRPARAGRSGRRCTRRLRAGSSATRRATRS
jgi:hypothetical protein